MRTQVTARLEWMLGPGYHEGVPPEASLWKPGSAGIALHGGPYAGGYHVSSSGASVCEQVNVAWQLRDVTEADGGFVAIGACHCVTHVATSRSDALMLRYR
jgi:hypothetical protein